jgi:adenosylcobinamide-GDP ribazoletransferase
VNGLRLALSWLTVLPVPAPTVDAPTCRRAITSAPVVGALIGGACVVVLWVLSVLNAPSLLAGLLAAGFLVLFTRGMHVDGLADTADGLGCYGPPERALAVMREGSAGPFAVVALILILGTQTVALAHLTDDWRVVVLACATGRAAFVLCCRKGIPAARPEGMGALVAGSQPVWTVTAWWVVLVLAGGVATPGRWWMGMLSVLLAGASTLALVRHVRRRFGGITGDVLGAASELASTVVLAVCLLS